MIEVNTTGTVYLAEYIKQRYGSQQACASSIGVSAQTISNWITEQLEPRAAHLRKLAEQGMDIDRYLGVVNIDKQRDTSLEGVQKSLADKLVYFAYDISQLSAATVQASDYMVGILHALQESSCIGNVLGRQILNVGPDMARGIENTDAYTIECYSTSQFDKVRVAVWLLDDDGSTLTSQMTSIGVLFGAHAQSIWYSSDNKHRAKIEWTCEWQRDSLTE